MSDSPEAKSDGLRAQLDAAIEVLDDAQRKRLLDWAGAISGRVAGAREARASIGPLAEQLHITSEGAADGRSVMTLEADASLLNPHGVLHGGAVYTLVDYSMGGVTMEALARDEICATIEIKISYLAAVREGTLTCGTRIIKQGRAVVFLESHVSDASGALVATATGSFAVIRRPQQ